jgi:hypothetical protein
VSSFPKSQGTELSVFTDGWEAQFSKKKTIVAISDSAAAGIIPKS